MRRLSARQCATPVVLALYIATSVVPQASLVVHHHDGDEHEHVHAFPLAAAPHGEHEHHHHHVDFPGTVELEEPDHERAGHAHWQPPYPLAARPAARRLLTAGAVVLLPLPARVGVPAACRLPTRSRGPPADRNA